jgi:hypothetical protein
MTFVPNAGLESLAGALGADSQDIRIEMFSCRKASALHKKRERQEAAASEQLQLHDGAMGAPTPSTGSTPLTSSTFPSIVEAGGALESFARSNSYGDGDAVLPLHLPCLVAVMNALYDADGFDFTGILTEEHFVHVIDPFAFEDLLAAAIGTPDLSKAWKAIGEAALQRDTSPPSGGLDASGRTPLHGPAPALGEWAVLFTLRPDCPYTPDETKATGPVPTHFFAYCKKTRLMVAIIAPPKAATSE